MPALVATAFRAEVVWLGQVADRDASLRAAPVAQMALSFAGMAGEAHGGLTRASCSRVTTQHPKGTEIRNVRQLSIVSAEELEAIAAAMGLAEVKPEWLGASMVVRGIGDFSHVPPSARLQGPSGATLVVDMENRPCQWPAKEIEAEAPGKGRAFKPAAKGRRGVTAWVEREGVIALGDVLSLHVPEQPVWAHYEAVWQAGR